MTSNWLSPLVRRLAVREWLSILAAMVLLAGGLGWQNGLGRLDQTLYDQFISQSGRPARDDILIVSIDDYSLAQLGRWPWPRTLHAELIGQIAAARPRAIGLDVIMSEPELTQAGGERSGDLALADVLKQNQRTVLPVVMTNAGAGLSAALPAPDVAKGARAFGHINLEHDNDGVVRSTYLYEGQNGVWWPHFSLALLQLANAGTPGDGLRNASVQPEAPIDGKPIRFGHWQRSNQLHIPFAGNNGHFRSIPYVSVLRGEVPPQFFTDKYVLIGATAIGMTDSYPTPVSGGAGAMAGIEINANILASLLDGEAIAIAKPWQAALFSVLPVLVALFGYFLLSPRLSLLLNAGMLLLTVAASYFALRMGVWFAPTAALLTLLISYPLWSWRRLEAAIDYLGQEFMRLDREPHVLPELASSDTIIEDVLERRMNAMENAARRVRDLRQFISDNLDSLPDATLVTNVDGHVLLANKHANQYFALAGHQDVQGAMLPYLFSSLAAPEPINQTISTRFDWWQLLDLQYAPLLADGISTQDQQGRDLLVKSAPCHSASNELTGWIVSVIDISPIRAAERSRDETLRFLSHDMRAPQASILALLELQHDPASALPQAELFARIEKACRKTLGLADNFVQLARAESHEYRLGEVDFQEMLYDATDEMWSLAKNKQIELATEILPGDYPVRADRALMTRALVNLISNAINYSPAGTRVTCEVRLQATLEGQHVLCSIADQGYGIAPHDQLKLFRRFQRLELPNQPRHEGIGLGLVFVKTVVERHLGEIRFASKVGEGTTFTIVLPSALPA
ncbi:CHASE2 domain-containing protein [Noviherbaspirillum sedimenti]|uniref:histidine kinase n=1 Tax=Noviherbaspirillum sedimenti TaxID=2320865 RepID=A0A3A3G1C9_9BURK|nr:CHASE2 domain-containing protein [Noviherbaspirillum sedimenti]RJG02278.1 CHASE2 domain-containing protein [Noviherbaspirillum sedimenti]